MGAVSSTYEGCFGKPSVSSKSSSYHNFGGQREHKTYHCIEVLDKEIDDIPEAPKLKMRKHSSFPFKDFDILELLGKGTFGKVYLVRNKSSEEFFALKTMNKHDILIKNILNCTLTDKSLMKGISHPFILNVKDSYSGNLNGYLLTEFCSGGNLSQRLEKDKKFNMDTVKFYAAELILALQYIHESLDMVHRDINPENILLASDGHIKLTDFGISKSIYQSILLLSKVIAVTKSIPRYGTPDYQAPESTSGHSYSQEADWWSLGCLIYHMLVGQPLFVYQRREKPIDHTIKELPELPVYFSSSLKDLLTRLLKKKPKDRLGAKGAKEIQKHAFFKDVDWDLVLGKQMNVPINVPSLEEKTARYEPIRNESGLLETYVIPEFSQFDDCAKNVRSSCNTKDTLSDSNDSPTK